MGNTAFHESLFIINRVTKWKTKDWNENIPLYFATSNTYIRGVCFLLELNGHSAIEHNIKTLYPIHLACKNGHVKVMVEMLKKQHCPMFVTNSGYNILHFVVKNGHVNMVKAIIKISETNISMDKVVN
ncbi:hypothetical protein CISIN_1g044402mg [Citrus sinensis]|uniref:Uncharacterized protein n=1 Tax=Citrus sinensis TaxID=2711 RepID=A0A067E2B5_CITSI|nr:hypothetical protein CISIN_1g044402mg [Citrus sinensis]